MSEREMPRASDVVQLAPKDAVVARRDEGEQDFQRAQAGDDAGCQSPAAGSSLGESNRFDFNFYGAGGYLVPPGGTGWTPGEFPK